MAIEPCNGRVTRSGGLVVTRKQIIQEDVICKNVLKSPFIHPNDKNKRQIDQYPKAINKHNEVTSWEWPQSDQRQRSKRL